METVIKIDPEFQNVLPPLTEEEFLGLERQIITEGCRNPLVLWGDVLVDGHNRYNICQKHNIEFSTVQHAFDSRDDVIVWIVDNQKDQRNLSNFAKAELALRVEPILKAKAKERMMAGKSYPVPNSAQGSQDKGKVRDELAKIAGVGHDTIERVKKIKAEADTETIEKVRKGEMSINKAFTSLKSKKRSNKDYEKQPLDIPSKTYSGGGTSVYRKERDDIASLVSDMYDETPAEYTKHDFEIEFKSNNAKYIAMIQRMINEHSDIVMQNKEFIVSLLTAEIIEKTNKMIKEIKDHE